ncbi:MAG: DUF1264 domain-containing protein [Nitrospirae bacterium]|nr:DUF1264 domain-containing protein [Nitrospirota bacterium]
MVKGLKILCALSLFITLVMTAGTSLTQEAPPAATKEAPPAAAKATPADGHTIHVTAPHLIDGKVRGPFHHYCKVASPEPFIECLLYETDDANAKIVGIEYIVAKTLTRNTEVLPKKQWKKVWHDHAEEIATGNVKVLDLPPDKAKEVADTVAKTDGIVFSLWPEGAKIPTGKVSMGMMVGHAKHK